MRLVQLKHPRHGRKVAMVEEPGLRIIKGFDSVYTLAMEAVRLQGGMKALIRSHLSGDTVGYDAIYNGESDWRLLPSFDHPETPLALLLSGTGLTHKASAGNRQKMHDAQAGNTLTDSMRMYLLGIEGGHPEQGKTGVQPEWFYKGNGSLLKAHGEPLGIPAYGDDGGEEPEIAGAYVIDDKGKPWRVGFTPANEFSDHVMERKNYLYLAPSKIRNCSIGPELAIAMEFQSIPGKVRIIRGEQVIWEKSIMTGERNMAHSLENLEYHHFKYDNHKVRGLAHIHFYGADAFSFGEDVQLTDKDVMQVGWEGMGRPLQNPLKLPTSSGNPLEIGRFS